MGTHSTPIHRKPLVDPAACGVRLGVELRAAAEQLAWSEGLCLSHWIKRLVEEFVAKASEDLDADLTIHPKRETKDGNARTEATDGSRRIWKTKNGAEIQNARLQQKDAVQSALDTAYAEKMEELKP